MPFGNEDKVLIKNTVYGE